MVVVIVLKAQIELSSLRESNSSSSPSAVLGFHHKREPAFLGSSPLTSLHFSVKMQWNGNDFVVVVVFRGPSDDADKDQRSAGSCWQVFIVNIYPDMIGFTFTHLFTTTVSIVCWLSLLDLRVLLFRFDSRCMTWPYLSSFAYYISQKSSDKDTNTQNSDNTPKNNCSNLQHRKLCLCVGSHHSH